MFARWARFKLPIRVRLRLALWGYPRASRKTDISAHELSCAPAQSRSSKVRLVGSRRRFLSCVIPNSREHLSIHLSRGNRPSKAFAHGLAKSWAGDGDGSGLWPVVTCLHSQPPLAPAVTKSGASFCKTQLSGRHGSSIRKNSS